MTATRLSNLKCGMQRFSGSAVNQPAATISEVSGQGWLSLGPPCRLPRLIRPAYSPIVVSPVLGEDSLFRRESAGASRVSLHQPTHLSGQTVGRTGHEISRERHRSR